MELKGDIQPLMILVEEIPEDELTKGGLIIPSTVKHPAMKGKVVKVGKGSIDYEMVIEEGQTVLFNPHSGSNVEIEGKEYRLMPMKDAFFYYWAE